MEDTTRDFFVDYYEAFCQDACDDLDEIDKTNVIAFTWSPDPNKYPSTEPRKQYKCLLKHILLSSYKYFRLFCFVPELTLQGNVHIHGWYVISDRIKYFKHFLPACRQYGFVKIKDHVTDDWYKYIEKSVSETIQILGADLPIPITHKSVRAYAHLFNKGRAIKYARRKYNIKDITDYFNNKK